MKLNMEIRPGEGGDDAKMLVNEQAKIYIRFAEKNNIAVEVIDQSVG